MTRSLKSCLASLNAVLQALQIMLKEDGNIDSYNNLAKYPQTY